MKSNATTKTAAILALAGIIHASSVYAQEHSFTPIEKLAPEIRKQIMDKINQVSSSQDIAWDDIVIGVDENGNVLYYGKTDFGLRPVASPSTVRMIDLME